MQFRLDEYDAVQELLDYLVFALVVLRRDLLPLHVCLLVDGDRCRLGVSRMLQRRHNRN